MVAMNADPSSVPELLGRTDLRLVPTPAEQDALGVPPAEISSREFSQGIYAQAVREAVEAESLPFEEEEQRRERMRELMETKDEWLKKLPEDERPDAVMSAYSFLLDAPHAKEQKVA